MSYYPVTTEHRCGEAGVYFERSTLADQNETCRVDLSAEMVATSNSASEYSASEANVRAAEAPEPHRFPFDSDLVEYLFISLPSFSSLPLVARALADLEETVSIRILDLLVIARKVDDAVEVFEADSLEALQPLGDRPRPIGRLLNDRDIELLAVAVKPATIGVIVVTEGSWAVSLARAARDAGGRIMGGERIPRSRFEAARNDGRER